MSDARPRPARRRPPDRAGLVRAFLDLDAAHQRIAAAALVVLVSLGTPWYTTEVAFPPARGAPASAVDGTITGISAFSFVEAGVLLVAGAVLVLVWARATGRRFSLPAGDGTVVTVAAGWLGVLVAYRLFDRPERETEGAITTLVGLSWGVFATLAAVGLLLATGLDLRRRDAERRAGRTPHVPDGPVVDPADLVPVAGGDPGAFPRGRAAPAGAGRPAADGSSGRTAAAADVAASGLPTSAAKRPRAWAFDDPDAPEPPAPAEPPSARRPTPPETPTRALGPDGNPAPRTRDLAGPDASRAAPPDPGATARGGSDDGTTVRPGPLADDTTRVVPAAPGDPAPVVSWDGADDPTRALPPAADRDADDATRVHGATPPGAEDGRRPSWRRRRRDGR